MSGPVYQHYRGYAELVRLLIPTQVEKQTQTRDAIFARLDPETEGRTTVMRAKGTSNPAALAVNSMVDDAINLLQLAQSGKR